MTEHRKKKTSLICKEVKKLFILISLFQLRVNNKNYYPLRKELVSKGMSFMIKLNYEDDLKKHDVLMHITDISHNKRVYKLIPDGSMVSDFNEI